MRVLLALAAAAAFATPASAQTMSGPNMSSMMRPKCTAANPVVWVNTRSKVYYLRGSTYYGKTTHGRYMCRSAAISMGDHQAGTATNGMMGHGTMMGAKHHGTMMPRSKMSPMQNGSMGAGTAPPMSPPMPMRSTMPMPMHSTMPMPMGSAANPAPSPYGSVPPRQ